MITETPVLPFFDKTRDIVVSEDACSYGVGGVLLQEGHPVAYASAALTPTQQKYAQIEKELLAIVFACEHFHYYTYGRIVTVQTDHKPLIGLQQKDFEKITPRLQRLLLRLQRYDVRLTYVPGKELTVADALSRAPANTNSCRDSEPGESLGICTLVNVSTTKLEQIRQATAADQMLQQVSRYKEKVGRNSAQFM